MANNMMQMMKQAASMRKEMKQMQKGLARQTVEFQNGNPGADVKSQVLTYMKATQVLGQEFNALPGWQQHQAVAVPSVGKQRVHTAQSVEPGSDAARAIGYAVQCLGELAVQKGKRIRAGDKEETKQGFPGKSRPGPDAANRVGIEGQTEKDSPQPQVFWALGLSKVKPLPWSPPSWSTCMPRR